MRCPTCEKDGLKSKVYIGTSTITCMGYAPYYDEEGQFHAHDPNGTQTSYQCSNGHKWMRWQYSRCWCGWSGGTSKIEIIEDQD